MQHFEPGTLNSQPMTNLSPSLRKAAILIAALDEDAAEELLAQMGAEQSAKVRSALMELAEIPLEEQQQVLAEFLQRQGSPATITSQADDVELALDPRLESEAGLALASQRAPITSETKPTAGQDESDRSKACPTLDFLGDVPPEPLANLMRREHPQTIAAVVAHLSPEQAAEVLSCLPSELATDALARMASLGEVAPEVLADLVRGLRAQLAPYLGAATNEPASVARLAAVLGAMDYRQRQRALLSLGQRNAALLSKLGLSSPTDSPLRAPGSGIAAFRFRLESRQGTASRPPAGRGQPALLEFDDLAQLTEADLTAVFVAADPEVALLALTGADERMASRVLRWLPARQAAAVRRRLEHPGPVRLREIDEARCELAALASRLAKEGTITLPRSVRFAAAA